MSEMEEQSGREEAQSHVVGRRCEVVRENGEPCRGIPAVGETRCHAHARYREASGLMALTIPLLDDEASITFVRSQTVRAMALGSIPPANGRVMLEGCRDAERRLDRRVATQNAALRYAALAERMGAEKLDGLMGRFVERMEEGAGATVQGAGTASAADEPKAAENPRAWWDELMRGIDEGAEKYRQEFKRMEEEDARRAVIRAEWDRKEALRKAGMSDELPAASGQQPENSDQGSGIGDQKPAISEPAAAEAAAGPTLSPENGDNHPVAPTTGASGAPDKGGAPGTEPEAVMHRSVFPGVKEQWDRALVRTEGKVTEMVAPKEGESWYDFLERKKDREAAIAAAV